MTTIAVKIRCIRFMFMVSLQLLISSFARLSVFNFQISAPPSSWAEAALNDKNTAINGGTVYRVFPLQSAEKTSILSLILGQSVRQKVDAIAAKCRQYRVARSRDGGSDSR
jgi:hypothetical protein